MAFRRPPGPEPHFDSRRRAIGQANQRLDIQHRRSALQNYRSTVGGERVIHVHA